MSYTLDFSGSEINTLLQKVNNANQPGGVAGLDENGKIDEAQLPDELNNVSQFLGMISRSIEGMGLPRYVYLGENENEYVLGGDIICPVGFTIEGTVSDTALYAVDIPFRPSGKGILSNLTKQVLTCSLNGLIPGKLYTIIASWQLVRPGDTTLTVVNGVSSFYANSTIQNAQVYLSEGYIPVETIWNEVDDGHYFNLQITLTVANAGEHTISFYSDLCLTEYNPALNTSQIYDPNISFEGNPVATQAQVNALVQTQVDDLEEAMTQTDEKHTDMLVKMAKGIGSTLYFFKPSEESPALFLGSAPPELPFTVQNTISSAQSTGFGGTYDPCTQGVLNTNIQHIVCLRLGGLQVGSTYTFQAVWRMSDKCGIRPDLDISEGTTTITATAAEEVVQILMPNTGVGNGTVYTQTDLFDLIIQCSTNCSEAHELALYSDSSFIEYNTPLNTSQIYDPNISFEGNPVATQAQVNALVQTQMAGVESELANKAEKSTQTIYTIDTGVFSITPITTVLHADFVTDIQEHYYVQFVDVDTFTLCKDYARTIVVGAGQSFTTNMDRSIYPGISLADGDVVQFKSIAADRMSFTMGYAGVTTYSLPEPILINENEKVTIHFLEYRMKYNSNNDVGIRMRWEMPNKPTRAWCQGSSGLYMPDAFYNDVEIGRAIPTYAKYIVNDANYTIIRTGTQILGQLQGAAMSCAEYKVGGTALNITTFSAVGQRFENVQAGTVSISALYNGVTGRTGHLIGNGSKYIIIREPLTEV